MKKKKRVLIVLGFGELGGAERQAIHLAEGLKTRGYPVSVLNFGPPGRSNQILDQKGIPNSSITIRIGGKPRHFKRDLRRLYFKLLRSGARVIIPFTRHPNVFCNAVGPFLPFTRVAWNQRDEGRELINERIERYAIGKAHVIISNSTLGKQALVDKFGLNPDRVFIINNGVKLPELGEPGREPRESSREPREPAPNQRPVNIGMIANLHQSKDHGTLIEAWHVFKKQQPDNSSQLFIAGRDDGLLNQLKARTEELQVTGSVKFLGQVKDIPGFISQLHIGVHSSFYEGCPNAILEMMSYGLPVIANDIPGNIDALGTDYPLYFPTGNSHELSALLTSLISDPELAASLGKQNRKRVANYFSLQQMVDNYCKLLGL